MLLIESNMRAVVSSVEVSIQEVDRSGAVEAVPKVAESSAKFTVLTLSIC